MIALVLAFTSNNAQTIKRSLLWANSIYFHQTVFVYGYEQSNTSLLFKCFSYDNSLQAKDSAELNLGSHTPSDYLEITVDTLHGMLNFYFQLADQKNEVTLFRLNKKLNIIATTKNYDANHINSLSAFDDEKYIFKEDLYIIRTASDTSGNQFYLSKYHLKAIDKPFEYDYKWQFAFERKYIHRASVLFADSNQVIVYAHVADGLKRGQWILRINAATGEIIRGTKLTTKSDPRYFLMSDYTIDKKNKTICIIGSIYDANMIDLKNKTSNFTNQSKAHKLFLVSIDSLGDVSSRVEKPFPLALQTKTGNVLQSFHLKIREFIKEKDGSYDVWSDIYEQTFPNIFSYYSSWHFKLVPTDVDFDIERSTYYISSKAVPNLISFTKGDTYGKFSLNDISEYDKFKYKKPLNEIVLKTGLDELNNSYYVLKKTDIISAKKTFNYVSLGKKGLENKIILKSEQGQKASIYFYKKNGYVSFTTNTANTEFELKLNKL